ncbi:MAG: thioredoxin family protein [Desulfobacterota bacterium]|nr:thioredoxin family protein [Thermodesulfobacteriota bacterium]
MEGKDYRLVLVGNAQVGLSGLQEIFEELRDEKRTEEPALKQKLLEKVREKNYVPSTMEEEYKKALFREFKKFLGEELPEEKKDFLEVILLGLGCFSCNQLEQEVIQALAETGLRAGFQYIKDPSLRSQYGNIPMPALIINGKVKSQGTIPTRSMIIKWLMEESG